MTIEYKMFSGQEIERILAPFADLRVTVFREFPYLYEGDLSYEKTYLKRYVQSPNSLVILAMSGEEPIGATTCIPLADEAEAFKKPFMEKGLDVNKVFYFGESIIFKEYRGQGIGSDFFKLREAHAKKTLPKLKWTTFCAVIREPDHPLRPVHYQPLDRFWQKRGYSPQPGMIIQLPWQDIDKDEEDEKALQVWTKPWS